jgi:glucose-6-phosphate 1-dehydrogenase
VAMDPPKDASPESIRDAKTAVLKCTEEVKLSETVVGQYTAFNGKEGYKDDEGVPKVCNYYCRDFFFVDF